MLQNNTDFSMRDLVVMNHERHEIHEKGTRRDELLFRDECYQIQGAIFEVYREMGSGFLEAVYQECLQRELAARHIPFAAQPQLALQYKGQPLSQSYRPDFICFDKIILELKSIKATAPEHKAQVINYLKASRMRLGLLINFGTHPKVSITRLAN